MVSTGADQEGHPRPVVRIFQSYGWHDATEIAERLKASLTEAGFEVWLDREQLRSDDKHFSLALEKAVGDCQVVVALLSPHSVRGVADTDDRSSICYNEIRLAEELLRPIVPVRVQKFSGPPPFLIIKYRRIDWLDWDEPRSYHRGVSDIVGTIERVLADDKNFDPDVAFQATNFASQLKTARSDFVGRRWLFSRLDAWLDGPRPCFLIQGATGHGKTSVVAELVRRNPGGRILAYHFCSPVPVTLDASAFVRSIAGMLANSIDAYAELLWNGRLADHFSADPHTMLSQGVLAPLHGLRMEAPGAIIVDALDEALGDVDDASQSLSLPDLLAGALDEFPDWLKLVVTTRPQAHIQRLFASAETCSLGSGVEDQRADLADYVARRLADPALAGLVGPDGEARERAVGLIVERGEGSFQYASSVLRDLGSGEIGAGQLDQLPRSLEALYYRRVSKRFGQPPANREPGPQYGLPRLVLEILLAAREPLTLSQLALLVGAAEAGGVRAALDALTGLVSPEMTGGSEIYRVGHKSVADWLVSEAAGPFRADPRRGADAILAHCRDWATHREPYALKHAVGHLIERGSLGEALDAVREGIFAERLAWFDEPRLDAEDSRNLTLALVEARDKAGILALATGTSTWQRDGVAAALQSVPAEDLGFVDEVVGGLLAVGA